MSGDAGGGHRYPDDEAEELAMILEQSEITGRTKRTSGFLLRDVRIGTSGVGEVMATDPARYMLEVIRGNHSHLHALTEADITALHYLTGAMMHGHQLPIADKAPR